jgi:hypothetical protein
VRAQGPPIGAGGPRQCRLSAARRGTARCLGDPRRAAPLPARAPRRNPSDQSMAAVRDMLDLTRQEGGRFTRVRFARGARPRRCRSVGTGLVGRGRRREAPASGAAAQASRRAGRAARRSRPRRSGRVGVVGGPDADGAVLAALRGGRGAGGGGPRRISSRLVWAPAAGALGGSRRAPFSHAPARAAHARPPPAPCSPAPLPSPPLPSTHRRVLLALGPEADRVHRPVVAAVALQLRAVVECVQPHPHVAAAAREAALGGAVARRLHGVRHLVLLDLRQAADVPEADRGAVGRRQEAPVKGQLRERGVGGACGERGEGA